MIAATRIPCPECGTGNAPDELSCRFCGLVLRPAELRSPAPAQPGPPLPRRRYARPPACEPHRTTVAYLAVGAVLAVGLVTLPLARYMGWFFASLVHEIGHCAVAWLAGCPAFPAIRLDGHAMARHMEQSTALAVVVWVGLAWLAWTWREHRRGVWVFGLLALLYPLVVFTGLREALFLYGGHLGELAFAGVFLWRGLVGGFTPSPAERALYAGLGIYLVGGNVHLAGGLIFSERARVAYGANGSFGLENDLIRVARDVLDADLSAAAWPLLLASLAVFPAAWWLSRGQRRGV